MDLLDYDGEQDAKQVNDINSDCDEFYRIDTVLNPLREQITIVGSHVKYISIQFELVFILANI